MSVSYCYLLLKEHIYYICNKLFFMKNIILIHIVARYPVFINGHMFRKLYKNVI